MSVKKNGDKKMKKTYKRYRKKVCSYCIYILMGIGHYLRINYELKYCDIMTLIGQHAKTAPTTALFSSIVILCMEDLLTGSQKKHISKIYRKLQNENRIQA